VMVKGAVLDAAVLSWIGQSPECFQFRLDTIKWIQDQLKDPLSAVSNATIGAIMTFTQWTVSYLVNQNTIFRGAELVSPLGNMPYPSLQATLQ